MKAAPGWRPGGSSALVLLRVVVVVVFVVAERVDSPAAAAGLFEPLVVAALAYALGTLVLARRGEGTPPFVAAADLLFLGALAATSGAAIEEIRAAFVLALLGPAFSARPLRTAQWGALLVACYVVADAVRSAGDLPDSLSTTATNVVPIALMAVVAVVISKLNGRIATLAASRRRLVVALMDAEERERKRLAEVLHDQPLQNLLAVRQDLEEFELGRAQGLGGARTAVDDTIEQLRGAVFALHPEALWHAGLDTALRKIASEQARRAGARTTVAIAPDTQGVHDRLLLPLARELLINAARHARPEEIGLSLTRNGMKLVLEVSDDGCGFDQARLRDALAEGHVGLAAAAERVEALGGSLRIKSVVGRGTRVRVTIPATVEVSSPQHEGEALAERLAAYGVRGLNVGTGLGQQASGG